MRMCVCVHACVYLFMALCARVCLYACVYGRVRMLASVFLHAFMCVCMCIKIKAYIHKIPMIRKFIALMLFRSGLLTYKYEVLRARCQTLIARIFKFIP